MRSFVLPYPPSANRYWRHCRGLTFISKEAKEYKVRAGYEAKYQGVQVQEGDLAVSLNVHRPQRRGDLDNTAKVLFDTLNGIAWVDDAQVVEMHLYRFDDKVRPRVEVTVSQK